MTRRARSRLVATTRAAAIDEVSALVDRFVPPVPECRIGDGLAAWIGAAIWLAPAAASPADVTRAAWRVTLPAAVLGARFRAAGVVAPRRLARAAQLAALGHAVAMGLTAMEFAESPEAARALRRSCAAVAAPYYDSAHLVLSVARRLDPSWAAERWLTPHIIAVPADAWARPLLLATVHHHPSRSRA